MSQRITALLQLRLLPFIQYTTPGWKPSIFHAYICQILEGLAYGEFNGRVIIEIPHQHGKSTIGSKSFPAWFFGKFPDLNVMVASYGAELAEDFSISCRDKLAEYGKEIFGVEISDTISSRGHWKLQDFDGKDFSGNFYAVGLNGAVNGRGVHLLIIDDLFKGIDDIHSPTTREKRYEWFRRIATTRVAPGGAIVIINTRMHEDDLIGKLKAAEEKSGEEWLELSLPAIAIESDIIGRQPGDPLWSERYDLAALKRIKMGLSPHEWLTLYQQTPTSLEGDMFRSESFRYFTNHGSRFTLHKTEGDVMVPLTDCAIFQVTDTAQEDKETSDYSVIQTWAITPELDILLIDQTRGKFKFPDLQMSIENNIAKWSPFLHGIEDINAGKAILQINTNPITGKLNPPYYELEPQGSKSIRALRAVAMYAQGRICHDKNAVYLDEMEGELKSFPHGKHDDMVDCVAYAAIVASEYIGMLPAPTVTLQSRYEYLWG